jgi:hypothetical protein
MKLLSGLLLISSVLVIVFAQRPRIPPGYEIVDRVPAEGRLAERPPQETALMARAFSGRDCFWIRFCTGRRRWARDQQCFWLRVCSTAGDDNNDFQF